MTIILAEIIKWKLEIIKSLKILYIKCRKEKSCSDKSDWMQLTS